MSLRALQESLQSAAWTPPQRRFFEQLIAYVLPRTLLPGSGINITQDAALGTLTFSAQAEARTLVFQYDISGDETTTLTTGTAKRTWRMPIPFTLRSAYASLTTGSSSGAVIVDVNADNSSVFGTNKLSIDQGEESSFTATTAVDLTEQLIDADVELTFDVDDDGTNAVGLKVYLVGVYAFDTELLMFGPLDDMTVGAAYSDTLSVLGGVKPYSITTPQSLPAGITATLNGGNNTPMTISGTPTGAGLGPGTSIPFLIRATVQDAANDVYTFSQTVTITVAAVVATIDGGALPDATVGVAYTHDVDATGGTGGYTFTKQAGPAWLSVNSSTGAITGTPDTGDIDEDVTVTVRATDSEGNFDDVTDTIDVLAAAGADPADIFTGGVRGFWIDPSDLSTMWQDTAGTTPVTTTGQSVARIDDKSGNGHHFTQSTSGNCPTLQHDGTNYYLSFDGSNDCLIYSDTSQLRMLTDDLNIFCGARRAASGSDVFFARSLTAGEVGRYWLYYADGFALDLAVEFASGGVQEFTRPMSSGVNHVIGGTIDRNVTNGVYMHTDGDATQKAYTQQTGNLANSRRSIIGAYNDASDTGESTHLDGRIYGMILWFAPVDSGNTDIAKEYLASKCGVTL